MSELANRLRKNEKRIGAWAKKHGITCFRIYDRDLTSVPLAIDRYETEAHDVWLHASVFEPRHGIESAAIERWMNEACEALSISAERTVVKRRASGETFAQYGKRSDSGQRLIVNEGGLRFAVNLVDYLDTGLFLDHRLTRARVAAESEGKRVLNLFSYTASFSLYAAKANAARTVSVDLSPTYAAWAHDNFALNGLHATASERDTRVAHHERDERDARDARDALAGRRKGAATHEIVTADALEWLAASRDRFDLVVIDPPTISKSKRAASFDVQRDHRRLIEAAIERVEPGGVIWFSTNFTGFTFDAPKSVVVDEKTAQTVPLDFSHRPPIHRSWRIEL